MRLTGLLQSLEFSEAERETRLLRVRQHLFERSRDTRQPDFQAIYASDLQHLFEAYDREFFDGQLRAALDGRPLSFDLSRRMIRSGGQTKQIRHRDGRVCFEIAVAATMLFQGFGPNDRRTTVCGIECDSRLDALERIFEHELVHLGEMLCWVRSNCSAVRFQGITARLFGHRSHTHNLITWRDRANEKGIRPGSQVAFVFEGRHLQGQVNRITRRATVLVEDPQGRLYSDGRRYSRYYVPVSALELKT